MHLPIEVAVVGGEKLQAADPPGTIVGNIPAAGHRSLYYLWNVAIDTYLLSYLRSSSLSRCDAQLKETSRP